MKSTFATVLSLLLLASVRTPLSAAVSNNDYLVLQRGKLHLFTTSTSGELNAPFTLANGYKVNTNGIVTINSAVEKQLRENQKLTLDGFLVGADGQLVHLEDHVTLRKGEVTVVKDGEGRQVSGALKLEDGTQILPRGIVVRPNGQRTRLLDGQMLRLSGAVLPVDDFVTLTKGVVTIQKDGSLMTISGKRSLMMSDGTKVLGNGSVLKPDGSRIVLKEGERHTLPGAAFSTAR